MNIADTKRILTGMRRTCCYEESPPTRTSAAVYCDEPTEHVEGERYAIYCPDHLARALRACRNAKGKP